MMSMQHFETIIKKSGGRTLIEIPFNPNDVWGEKSRHYISGAINGCRVRGALGLDGSHYFLSLGAVWCHDNGLDAGAKVDVTLSPEGPQAENMSADIAKALESHPQAQTFFESLATFYRNNYIKWIESAKRPETRSKRIDEMIELLTAGQKEK